MTRDEQLAFCTKCLNRKSSIKQGIICNITNERATFQNECPDFKIDETVNEILLDDKKSLSSNELQHKLPLEIIEKLRLEQKLIPGILAGLIVGILGAILWAVITVSSGYQIGYMAIAIGAGVGFAIRKLGNGIDKLFGFWGAGISFLSVLLGNALCIIGFVANAEGFGYFEAMTLIDFKYLPEIMVESFSIMDLAFYGFAIYEGYKFSFRKITEKSIVEITEMNGY